MISYNNKKVIKSYVIEYIKLDDQIETVNKTLSELKKRKLEIQKKIEEGISMTDDKLDCSKKITCKGETLYIDYVSPKTSLSKKLLKLSFDHFFKTYKDWKEYDSKKVIDILMYIIDENKKVSSIGKKKKCKIRRN